MKPLALAHLPAGSPAWLSALIGGVLALHIAAGSAAIATGYVAIWARKGGAAHRRAGLAFLSAMVVMGAAASFLAARIPDRGNIAAGLLAAYLVASGWMTIRRPPLQTGRFERTAFAAVSLIAIFYISAGLTAWSAPSQRLDNYPPAAFFAPASLAAFFAWGDWRMLRKGGLAGKARLARHAGRMGFALFFATGSFFIGQQKVMPPFVRGSPLLFALGLAPLALTLFWLVRIRLPARRQRPASA